jgi:pSer/pThr/pTyr-binding forkhead associated (FHA) protein
VGRHPESDVFLDDLTVSRRHAKVRRDGGDFVIDDTGSLNGTYVNRERVGTAVLARGDEVGIGKFRLVFLTRWRLLVPPGRAHLPCEDERPLPAPALH